MAMRVELIYAPGCSSYRKALNTLETVIAEERLPLPVELVEDGIQTGGPSIRINGDEVGNQIDSLRGAICQKWRELTEAPLLGI